MNNQYTLSQVIYHTCFNNEKNGNGQAIRDKILAALQEFLLVKEEDIPVKEEKLTDQILTDPGHMRFEERKGKVKLAFRIYMSEEICLGYGKVADLDLSWTIDGHIALCHLKAKGIKDQDPITEVEKLYCYDLDQYLDRPLIKIIFS